MSGSGLQEILETTYAPNSVMHMPNGKVISRALRGHMLVFAALNTIVASAALAIPIKFPESLDNQPSEAVNEQLEIPDKETSREINKIPGKGSLETNNEVKIMWEGLLAGNIDLEQVSNSK